MNYGEDDAVGDEPRVRVQEGHRARECEGEGEEDGAGNEEGDEVGKEEKADAAGDEEVGFGRGCGESNELIIPGREDCKCIMTRIFIQKKNLPRRH